MAAPVGEVEGVYWGHDPGAALHVYFMIELEELITTEFWARSVWHIKQNTCASEVVDVGLLNSNEVQLNPNIIFVRINNVRLLLFKIYVKLAEGPGVARRKKLKKKNFDFF